MTRSAMWLAPLWLMACGPDLESDEDEDGLTYGQEDELGTDPTKADSDADGVNDGDEVARGMDPTKNSFEAPYGGGWPRQAVEIKDQVEAEGRTGDAADVGKRFPRMMVKDQHGDVFDLYDLARQGKPIVVDISAEWCPPCNALSAYLAGQDEYQGAALPDALGIDNAALTQVEKGSLFWVTVLSENNSSQPPTADVVERWEESYPSEYVPVLLDKKQEMIDYVINATNAWPTLVRLDTEMKIKEIAGGIDADLIAHAVTQAKKGDSGEE